MYIKFKFNYMLSFKRLKERIFDTIKLKKKKRFNEYI